MSLRPGLRWALAVSVAASGAALLWPGREAAVLESVRTSERAAGLDELATMRPPSHAPGPASTDDRARPLPRELPVAQIDAARFDPFVGVVPPPPPPPPVVAAPPPPPPQAPAPSYRFMGRMSGPDGAEVVYLMRGDSPVAVQPGTRLDDGYVVEAITKDAVRLLYPSMDARASIPIPPPADPALQ